MIACRDDELDPSPAELFVYRCVAANLAAAFRCRRVRASSCTDIARERVRSSAQAVTPRANPDRNAEWAALSSSLRAASARLTLVDTFEESGQRYVVAQESAVGGVATLTGRERQIVARAMLGYTNKQIAYDLGISDATVRVLMARAAGRLGVRTRRELLAHPSLEQLILNTGESAPFRASEEACELPASSPLS
jgi:DNA-binding CsgD family transcriptional regulator